MLRRPPRSTRTDTLFPYPTLFRSESILSSTIAAANGNDENASAYSTCHPARLCPMIPTRWRSTNPAEHRSSIAASYPCILTFASSKGCVELPGGGGPTCSTAMPLFARGCAKYTDRPGPSVGLIQPRPYSVQTSPLDRKSVV